MKPANLGRLGIQGLIGAGLALFCLSFYASSLLPARSALESLEKEEARLTQRLAGKSERQGTSVSVLPSASSAPEVLEHLAQAAAETGFAFDHLTYRMTKDEGVHRYEVTLPLKGAYPEIREFLKRVLTVSPSATLDEIELRRATATDRQVDAQARISYYFAP